MNAVTTILAPVTMVTFLATVACEKSTLLGKQPPPATAEEKPAGGKSTPYASLGYSEGLFTLDNKVFSGISEESYKSGQLKSRYQFKEGVYHGLIEEWYDNGKKKTHTNYVGGKHEGENLYWNSDGSPQSKKIWHDDSLVSEEHFAKP